MLLMLAHSSAGIFAAVRLLQLITTLVLSSRHLTPRITLFLRSHDRHTLHTARPAAPQL